MNTILLQKILDILTEGLAHVGNFFKDLFVSDPQDGQVIAYDAETGHWMNKDATEVELDLTNTFESQPIATLTDGAENVPMKSLVVDIVPKQASGTPTPANPLYISGTDSIVITHTYGDNVTETKTVNLPSTVYGGEVDMVSGSGTDTHGVIDLGELNWNYDSSYNSFSSVTPLSTAKKPTTQYVAFNGKCEKYLSDSSYNTEHNVNDNTISISQNRYVRIYSTTAGTDPTTFKASLSGVKLVYELATPTPITTTPTQIKTRGGTESIWSDTGDVSGEYYTKTAAAIKDLVTFTEDITSQVTANTTDWSSLQYKVVKNNNVVTVYIYSATTTEHGSVELFSGLPRAAYNGPVLLYDTDNNAVVNAKVDTSGYLDVTLAAGGTVKGTITYVAK